jgi:hypothetical protein
MQVYLKKHAAGFSTHTIKATWSKVDSALLIEFEVQKKVGSKWITDSLFTSDWNKNWGLWNKDVVEVFLQLRDNEQDIKSPYLELQVSPLNQPFALIITEPRKNYFPPKHLDLRTEVHLTDKLWSTKLEVILPAELRGRKLYGGFFACLSAEPREYYALEPNAEDRPDFHRPELFVALE